jgi:threonine dehydrogenase-like Zn-dependent dehydrogenase
MFGGKADTDIYFDAAGAPAVIDTALAAAKTGARIGVVAVHKQPVAVDFLNLMSNELTIVGSMGYPEEIFEVTEDLIANWEKYAVIISHTIPFDDVNDAFKTATTPGAADKVVVTFN